MSVGDPQHEDRSDRDVPIPLSLAQRARRAGRTGAALAKIYLGYKGVALIERRGLERLVPRARARWDETSARTLHDAAMSLGGLLLKAGQFIGARPDVLPRAYVRRLVRLQDRVPPHPFRVVRRVIEEELGQPPEELFARIWRRPIASASLAQVHRATLADGRDVAVKVQRPDIAAVIEADLANLRLALGAVERLEGSLGLDELLVQLEQSVPRELDFEREAASMHRMRRCFEGRPGVRIPAVLPELTRRRVLVTDFVAGIKVTERSRLIRAGIDPAALVRRLLQAYAAQILEHGFFHADPHPGNLLAVPQDHGSRAGAGPELTLAFVDFGLVEELSPAFRAGLLGLGAPLLRGDAPAVGVALEGLGLSASPAVREQIGRLLVELVRRKRATGKRRGADLAEQLAELTRREPQLRIPTPLWLIARVLGLIWGTAAALGVPVDPFAALAELGGSPRGTPEGSQAEAGP